jgi:hypothetical protein
VLNANDNGILFRDFHVFVYPSLIDLGDPYDLAAEEERHFFDETGHMGPVMDKKTPLLRRNSQKIGFVRTTELPGGI